MHTSPMVYLCIFNPNLTLLETACMPVTLVLTQQERVAVVPLWTPTAAENQERRLPASGPNRAERKDPEAHTVLTLAATAELSGPKA